MKRNKLLLLSFLLLTGTSIAQIQDYAYQRRIEGVSDTWHKITLPDSLFSKLNARLSDLRVYGITANQDTIEAPYLLRQLSDKRESREIEFKLLNTSHRNLDYYFTFEIPSEQAINHLDLEFKQQNFDWPLVLEGSHDQKEWFTVGAPFRLVSIHNEQVQFSFTTLKFAAIKYPYLRIHIKSTEQPDLISAHLREEWINEGKSNVYPVKNWTLNDKPETKQTEIILDLGIEVPINKVQLFVHDTFDYYRTLSISYPTSEMHTEKGDFKNYSSLHSGVLNSLELGIFEFPSRQIQQLKILIDNQDNQALQIDSIHVSGPAYEMLIRFTQEANYALFYGNEHSSEPRYDIQRFTDKIPEKMGELGLGEEQIIPKEMKESMQPLFENKTWLYAIMALIIALLGWFTFRMMKKA